MVIIEKQPKRDVSYSKYVFLAKLRMKNLKNQEEFFTKRYHSKCSPRNFEGLKKKLTYVVITDHPQVQFGPIWSMSQNRSAVGWTFKIFCTFTKHCQTNIYLKNWKGEIFRLEMIAVFVNLDRCLRFTFNGGFSVFLLSNTKFLWCFINSLDPTLH